MQWSDLARFISAHEPAFDAAAKGVPLEDIAVLEERIECKLPDAYREFLLHCGESAGELHPLGPTWDHRFYRLVEDPPDETFLDHRLVRIGQHIDESAISPHDIFLQVETGESADGMLVDSEAYAPYDREWLAPRGLSFLDQVTRRTFGMFELQRRDEAARLIGRPGEQQAEAFSKACDVLARGGLEIVLQPSERVAAMHGPATAALVIAREDRDVLLLELAGDDRKQHRRLVELLLDHVPSLKRARELQSFDTD